MMTTVVSCGDDALNLLFEAAQREERDINSSRNAVITHNSLPMLLRPSTLPAASTGINVRPELSPELLETWNPYQFVKVGRLSAEEMVLGWEEAMTRAKEFKRIDVDAVFVDALPDRECMRKCVAELNMPVFVNIIEGGKTENLSATDLAALGFCAVAHPRTLVAAKLKSIRKTLEALKKSMTEGAPPMILSSSEVCEGVGFNKYWEYEEERYRYNEGGLLNGSAVSNGY
ncbi:Phosphoenolpyruvate/pyruvate domain-containing protein [Lentithecium fluviatile CBS 122367]|uniref:Phosphoenolpyruvate/pyruvate domain-containing protein n=1 Tax=Lentithecium fluviatile CBS 122367 TaxID=1168545 RepID=A0A6G1J3F3_9PLEO|nr:Phosphoenolpyruvate/pyruvate domain-containing protein [Lentithecium fluviatile CBS 122367]